MSEVAVNRNVMQCRWYAALFVVAVVTVVAS
jgi:hypothetical protein